MKCLLKKILVYFVTFVFLEMIFRSFLVLTEFSNLSLSILSFIQVVSLGLLADLVTFLWFIPLLIAIYAFNGKSRFVLSLQAGFYTFFLFSLLFYNVSQYFFWDELGCRFNFIAVDYLVYTKEVIGNIKESYNVFVILLILALISIIGGYIYYLYSRNIVSHHNRRHGAVLFCLSMIALVFVFLTVSEERFKYSDNRYNNEIAKNGMFSLFSAFFNNQLDYKEFYLHYKDNVALDNLRDILKADNFAFIDQNLTHKVVSKKKTISPNIVLITVESLSAEYLSVFGNKNNLTPNLDNLIKDSLIFTNVYATGTRTVYGLSAVTLSLPPVPGNSIVRRPNNNDLFSLSSVLNKRGYESKFIYGGFGYFDNMNTFFDGNGYKIIDRSSLKADEVSFSNVWGVSDEDLFNKVIKENDESFARGKSFFDMIMTTSNHRPFTYPDNKIDIPSGGGRHGGVKYTDYAIGEFIAKAKTKPWFNNTIFVIVADHTAGSAGHLEVTPEKHHIPMIFYAPSLIKSGANNILASQIDLAPTLLGIMGLNYDSRFYGHDLLTTKVQRAFIASYQYLGLLKPDELIILKPQSEAVSYKKQGNQFIPQDSVDKKLLTEAIAYFQNASNWREFNRAISN